MKRVSALAVSLFLGFGVLTAQVTDAGNFVIGSTLGLSTAKTNITFDDGSGESEGEGPSSTQFRFAPSVAYFPLDNLAVGIRMDYAFNKVSEKEPFEDKIVDSDLLFGPFARYYMPVGDDMAFLLEAGFGFGNASDEQSLGGEVQNINTNIFAVGVGPGFTIVSKKAVGLEALIKYSYARSKFDTEIAGIRQETTSKTNQFDISVGVQFYFSAIKPAQR